MAISVQANTAQPPPQNAAQTLAQALRPGQVVEARVVGGSANGATQLAIGGQIVEAALAVRLPPGALLQLLVQGSGQNAQLTVLLQTTPAQLTVQTPAPQPAHGQALQTAQPAPQPGQTPRSLPPQQLQVQTQPSTGQVSAQPAPASSQAPLQAHQPQTQAPLPNTPPAAARPQGQLQPAPAQTVIANARPVTGAVPVLAGVPATGSAPQPQSGGAVPQAIAASAQNTAQAPQLVPGTVLRVQVSGSGANARPVLVPVAAPGGSVARTNEQAPPQPNSPVQLLNPAQQVLTQSVQQSVLRQDSIATLLTNLAGFGVKIADLPKPLAQAGTQVLAGRLNLNTAPLDGAGLKSAFTKSGVLFESALLQGGAKTLPQGDLKGALLNLRNVLFALLGKAAPGKAAGAQNTPPPPPTAHAHPRAGRPVSLPLSPVAPNADTPARLLGQNEAALARMRLVQISSLPDAAARPGQGPSGSAPEMNIELPLIFGNELSIGQFQIFKDGSGGADGDENGEWKMRFSINFSQIGEVGATVTLRGGKTGVMLWAEREETALLLQEMAGELEASLSARGLEPGSIRCRHGHPPQAKKPVGSFMDNCS